MTFKENSGDKVVLWTAVDFADEEKSEGEVMLCSWRDCKITNFSLECSVDVYYDLFDDNLIDLLINFSFTFKIQQFALRFKNSDRAGVFKHIFEEGGKAASSDVLLEPGPDAINTSFTGCHNI